MFLYPQKSDIKELTKIVQIILGAIFCSTETEIFNIKGGDP